MNFLFAVVALAVVIGMVIQHMNHAIDGSAAIGNKSMRAIVFADNGPPSEVLEMASVPVPAYRSWEVLVEVHASSINPVDYKIIEGAFSLIDLILNHRPGFDFSGKVVAVGDNVKNIQVGDVVHGMTWVHKTGTLAEYLAIDESAINVVPTHLSHEEAAALPLVALTSYSSLITMGKLSKGQRVLVLGGSSATGMMALQLAKAYGASLVTTTCSPRNEELVKSLGADETVNYRDNDVFEVLRTAGKSFDVIYDTVGAGKAVWDGAVAGALAPGGKLVTITGDIQRDFDLTEILTRGYQIVSRNIICMLQLGGGRYYQYTQPGGNYNDLLVLDSLVKEGKLKAIVDKTYTFELSQVKEAFKYLMTGHAQGKVVINVKSNAT